MNSLLLPRDGANPAAKLLTDTKKSGVPTPSDDHCLPSGHMPCCIDQPNNTKRLRSGVTNTREATCQHVWSKSDSLEIRLQTVLLAHRRASTTINDLDIASSKLRGKYGRAALRVLLLFGMPKIQCCRVGKKNTYQVSGAYNKSICTVCQETPVRNLHSSHPSVAHQPAAIDMGFSWHWRQCSQGYV